MAISPADSIVYHGSPSGATVIPNGSLPFTALPSVMTPALVTLAILPFVAWVNQTVPSGEAAMSSGPGLAGPWMMSVRMQLLQSTGNSVIAPVGVMRAILVARW